MALRVGFYTVVVEKDWAVQEFESLSKLFELLSGSEYREDDHLSAASYMTFDDLQHTVSFLQSVDCPAPKSRSKGKVSLPSVSAETSPLIQVDSEHMPKVSSYRASRVV